MKGFSLKTFLNIIYDTVSSSPTTITTIIVGLIFLIAMIISIKKNKKMRKLLFIGGWIFVFLFLLFRYSNNLTILFDNLINNVFMQIFFPNFAIYVIMVIVSNFIFLFTILNAKSTKGDKITNAIFYIAIIVFLIMILERVTSNNINIYDRLTTYSDSTLLVLIQSSTIIFTIWILVIISKYFIKRLIRKSDINVREKYVPKNSDGIEVLKL